LISARFNETVIATPSEIRFGARQPSNEAAFRSDGRPNEGKRGAKMSKQVLVEAVKRTGLGTSAAGKAVDAMTIIIAKELKKSQRFSIPGFGSFHVSKRAARMGRNPRTGEPIKIKASKGVRFKAGAKLKGSL
jgi:DNA-binding protein HU-beta